MIEDEEGPLLNNFGIPAHLLDKEINQDKKI